MASVLVVPRHGRAWPAHAGLLRSGGDLHAVRSSGAPAHIPVVCGPGDPGALDRLRNGMAGGGNRAPAVDGLRSAADLAVRVDTQRRVYGVFADWLCAPIHAVHSDRAVPDGKGG